MPDDENAGEPTFFSPGIAFRFPLADRRQPLQSRDRRLDATKTSPSSG